MIVSSLSERGFARQLAGAGLAIRIPPVAVAVRSRLASVAAGLRLYYADHPLVEDGFADFHIEIAAPGSPRRWLRPQVDFIFDGFRPFKPLPQAHAYPMFEWGLNWCIANHCHQYVMIHAAVIERDGYAAVLAAPPGSGKSTLCAGLVSRGWRLLSDELALIDPERLLLVPVPRPISLKNASIDVIRHYVPDAVMGPPARDTHKGTVTHLRAPSASIARASEPARPAWLVFPRYQPGAGAGFVSRSRARAVVGLMDNAFNYSHLARRAFETLARLADRCTCHDFAYADLDEAAACFAALPLPGAR